MKPVKSIHLHHGVNLNQAVGRLDAGNHKIRMLGVDDEGDVVLGFAPRASHEERVKAAKELCANGKKACPGCAVIEWVKAKDVLG